MGETTLGGHLLAAALRTCAGSRNHTLIYRGEGSPCATPHQANGVLEARDIHTILIHMLTNTHTKSHSKQQSTSHTFPNTHISINTMHTDHTQTLTFTPCAPHPTTKPHKKIVHTNTYTQVSHTHINKHIFVTTSASHSFHICFCNPWQRLRGICGEHVTVEIKGMGEMSCEDAGVGEMALWGDRLGEINVQRILTFERCHRGEAAGPALLWLGHVVFCRSSHSLLPFLSLSWKGGFALSVFPRVLLCLYLSQNSFLSLSRSGWLPGGWR